ncbi:MAG: hypothetical protein JNM33_02090, partial [Rubrivivax sp.]|nr:hypothetical protein [Rubrivivax sp.]
LSPQDTQDPQWLATRKRLEGDLDNILLKALEKAPEQRYASVEALAADVRAFLAGYPVSARPPRPLYLLHKFVSRNRVVVTVAALGVAALAGGLVATTWQWQRAEREHAAAERRFAQVRELANRLLFEYHDAIHLLPGSTAVRERMLKDAREHLQSLAAEAAGQPRLQRELGVAYRRLGELYHAEARPALGDVQTSLQLITQGRALLEQAAAAEPADAATRYQLALAQVAVARSQRSAGQPRLALAPLEQAAALFDVLAAERPREAAYRIEQVRAQLHLSEVFGAGSTAELADSARARAYLDKATGQVDAVLRDLPDDPDAVALYCTVHNLRWLSEANAGRYEAGLAILRSLVPLFARLQTLAPDDTLFRRDAAVNFLSQGTALMRLQRWGEARAASAEALRRMQAIAAADPANRVTQRDVAKLLGDVAWSDFKLGHGPLAAAGFAQSIDSLEALARHDPRDRRVARLLALAHGQRAEVQAAAGQAGDVARHLERALALAAAQRAASPDDTSSAVLEAQLQTQAGLSWATLPGGTPRSCPPFRDALAAWQALEARGQMRAGDRPRLEQARAGAARCGP